MSVTKCILGKAASGIIDKEFAEANVKKIEQFEKQLEHVPGASIEKMLTDFANQLKHLSDVKKLQLVKEIQAKTRLETQIAQHKGGKIKGLMATLTHDLSGNSTGLNVDKLREGVRAQAFGNMPDAVTRLNLQKMGMKQDRKLAEDVVRALFGADDNELAGRIGKQFADTMEMLRLRFNAAGGDFPALDNYHLPQSHDSRLLNKVSEDEWVEFITPLIDRNKMIDNTTGNIMSEETLDRVLRESYETLRTNGLNKLEPGKGGKAALANKYATESRILHFKDADSWLAYNQRFGNGDVYKTMVDYVDNMANDIAFLEIYGPNPEKMKRYLVDELRKEAGLGRDEKLKNKAKSQLHAFEVLWQDVSGETAVPVDARVAKVCSEIRAGLTSAQLGSAFLTQFSDLTSNALTAKFNGLPATDLAKNYIRLMTSNKYRDFSIHIGLGAEEVTRTLSSAARYAEGFFEQGKLGRLSNFIMQASLLERMTMASKKAFGLDFAKAIADNSKTEFFKLNKGFKRAFERYGITEADWNVVRASAFDDFDGARYLNLRTLAAENLDVANKVQNMIMTERDFAVIDSNARTRSVMIGGSQAGTFWGEARRFFAMYKTFPITMLTHHMSRMMSLDAATSRAGYAAALFLPMTFMGYLTLQAKNIVNGKKPLPADNWKTWISAAATGGACGILGDFLFSDESRTGNSMIANLVGPGGSLVEDVWKITGGAAKRALAGDDVAYPAEVLNFIRRYMPGNNLWYTKLALERLIFDQASLAIDPKARARFRRIERKFNKDYGTGYWWRPGEVWPAS